MPAIVDEKMWIPELDREDLLYHRLFLAEKWLVLKLRYGHADPRDAGVGNIVNCGAAMYIAPVGIANAGDPRRRVRRGARPHRRAPVELRPRGRGRAGGRGRRGDAARGDGRVRRRDVPRGSRRTRRATAIEAVAEAAAKLDGWRDGGLAELRRAFAPFDSVGEHYASPAQNARIPSRLHAIEELPIALGLLVATGGDYAETVLGGVNYGRDSDSIASMGGALAGRARRIAAAPRLGRRGLGREQDRRRGAGPRRWPSSRPRSSRETRSATRSGRGRWPRSPPERCLLEGDVDPAGGPRRARAPAGARGGQGRRRVEERWFGAGGAPAPGARRVARSRSRPSCGRSRSSCSTSSTRCRGRSPAAEPEGFDEILAAADPARRREPRRPARPDRGRLARPRGRLRARQAGREHPARGDPRDRARRRATGRSRGWFTAEGLPGEVLGALAVEPREPPDEPRREHRRHPRGRRPQLHDARRRAARALRHRLRRARRREALARLPAAGPDLHGRAGRDAQPARGVPAARDGDAPQPVPRVDRRAAARRRVRLGRAAATRSRRRGWRGRTRASATPRTASTRRCSWRRRTRPRSPSRRRRPAPTSASRSCPRESRLAEALRDGARARRRRVGGGRRRALRALRRATTGCTRSTTRRSSPRRSTPSTATSPAAICGGRPGRLGHRHERRRGRLDPRRARRGRRDRRALDGAARRPVRELAAGLRRDHARRARRGGRSPSPARPQRREHPARGAARPARPAADRPADRRAARAGRRPRRRSTARRSSPRPTTRPTGPPGATRSTRWREEAAAADRLRRRAPTSAGARLDAALLRRSRSSGSGTSCSTTTPRAASRPSASAPRPSASSAASTAIVLWHAYPVIGIDERNQFDFYRDVPGHPRARRRRSRRAASASSSTTTRGTSARGASRSRTTTAIAELVRELGADGVFLDTMKEAQPGLRAALDGVGPGSRSRASRRCRSRASATTTSPGRSGSPTARCPACSARAGSSSGTCSTTRAAGTATTPRSCTARG